MTAAPPERGDGRIVRLLDRGELVDVELDTLLREFDDCPQCGFTVFGGLQPIVFYDELDREVAGLVCDNCEWRGVP